MSQVLRAEWTKLRTLAGMLSLLAAAVALTVAASIAVVATTHQSSAGGDPTKLMLSGIYLGQVAIVVLAVLTISEEYATGMIVLTLTAVPRRLAMLAAKAANLAGLNFAAGVLAVAGCLITGRLLLPGAGFDAAHGYASLSIAGAATLRAAAGSVIYLVLVALLALGVATAVRDTAVSIGTVLALLYLPTLLAQVLHEPVSRYVQQIAPMSAGLAIQATANLRSQPIGPWAGIGVLAGWTAAALLLGGLLLELRDA